MPPGTSGKYLQEPAEDVARNQRRISPRILMKRHQEGASSEVDVSWLTSKRHQEGVSLTAGRQREVDAKDQRKTSPGTSGEYLQEPAKDVAKKQRRISPGTSGRCRQVPAEDVAKCQRKISPRTSGGYLQEPAEDVTKNQRKLSPGTSGRCRQVPAAKP